MARLDPKLLRTAACMGILIVGDDPPILTDPLADSQTWYYPRTENPLQHEAARCRQVAQDKASWAISCARAGKSSAPRRSALRRGAGGGRRGCGARKLPSSPASAST